MRDKIILTVFVEFLSTQAVRLALPNIFNKVRLERKKDDSFSVHPWYALHSLSMNESAVKGKCRTNFYLRPTCTLIRSLWQTHVSREKFAGRPMQVVSDLLLIGEYV